MEVRPKCIGATSWGIYGYIAYVHDWFCTYWILHASVWHSLGLIERGTNKAIQLDLKYQFRTYMMAHINDFNPMFTQLTCSNAKHVEDVIKVMFLLCSFQKTWCTFHMTISNLAPHDIVNSSNMKLTSSPWHLLVEMYDCPWKSLLLFHGVSSMPELTLASDKLFVTSKTM